MPDLDPAELVNQLLEFLRSFKNAESLEPELRRAISVPTGLEDIIVNALEDQRVVLLTGSAGSGKTHLLQAVKTRLEGTCKVIGEPKAIRDPHVLMIEDATVLSPSERIDAISRRSSARRGTLIAINEGPLREAADLQGGDTYQQGVNLLHAAKRGHSAAFDASRPTIIDMAAYDPLEANVLENILGLPLLKNVVSKLSSSPRSVRGRAWVMLEDGDVRRRIAHLVQIARLVQPEWLFRDVWDFVADLALGGSDDADPPTSAWFWRVFYGNTALSNAIRFVADPLTFALPLVESRIFYREWNSEHLRLISGLRPIPLSGESRVSEPDWATWVKTQYLILGEGYDLTKHVHTTGEGRLLEAVWRSTAPEVLRYVNDYIMFGLKEGSATRLDLWVDHRVERRGKHHEGLIRLGDASAAEFEIAASRVVANHPSGDMKLWGKDRFLVHTRSGAALALDRARLRTLETARSLRIADRTHADLDWDLHAFFAKILVESHSKTTIDVHKLNVDVGYTRISKYSVSQIPPAIEEA